MSLKSPMPSETKSYRMRLEGLVQGVVFRPYLYQLSRSSELQGFVMNTGDGLIWEVQGIEPHTLDSLIQTMKSSIPREARLDRITIEEVKGEAVQGFHIRASEVRQVSTRIPWDVAPCVDCLKELRDPLNRRYRYAFISCSVCGPRFPLLRQLPFDREHTAMDEFPLCVACQREYTDPKNRRFHAQTISCADCGPTLNLHYFWDRSRENTMDALQEAVTVLRQGGILALKGIGGYQLAALAQDSAVVGKLRQRKKRPEKPLAVMFPDLKSIESFCFVNDAERDLLNDTAAPIVLLKRKSCDRLSELISLDLPFLGAMLPSSALHELLLQELQAPLVMTSATLSGNPILKDEDWQELQQLADAALTHNRKIVHRADDSVVRMVDGQVLALRRGRGMAPYTLELPGQTGLQLALGAEEKNCFALKKDQRVTVSQHIGHLGTYATSSFWKEEILSFCRLLQITPDLALHDRHPEYHSTQMASTFAPRIIGVPHHQAHVLSCVAEHRVPNRALTLAWDGAGLGEDGTIWGGEGFIWDPATKDLKRIASLYPFPLIGGDSVAREPRRSALGLATVIYGADMDSLIRSRFPEFEEGLLRNVINHHQVFFNTSSVARLFDAVASLLDLRQICTFEGQAALLLEACADDRLAFHPFTMDLLKAGDVWLCDWRPMFREILGALREQIPASIISARFHHSLVMAAEMLLEKTALNDLILSGGVFQNKLLVESLKQRARELGYHVWNHSLVPPNDAGLAVGQLAWMNRKESSPCV